jgi:hypothetical protein
MYKIPICIGYQGMLLTGHAYPVKVTGNDGSSSLQIFIQGWYLGILSYKDEKWTMDKPIDPEFVKALGNYIHASEKSIIATAAMNYF